MSVTLKYRGAADRPGVASIYASVADAEATAAHEALWHGVTPTVIVDGDHGESHAEWEDDVPPEGVTVLRDAAELAGEVCDCYLCEFHRRTADFGTDRAAEKQAIWQEVYNEKVILAERH